MKSQREAALDDCVEHAEIGKATWMADGTHCLVPRFFTQLFSAPRRTVLKAEQNIVPFLLFTYTGTLSGAVQNIPSFRSAT